MNSDNYLFYEGSDHVLYILNNAFRLALYISKSMYLLSLKFAIHAVFLIQPSQIA